MKQHSLFNLDVLLYMSELKSKICDAVLGGARLDPRKKNLKSEVREDFFIEHWCTIIIIILFTVDTNF